MRFAENESKRKRKKILLNNANFSRPPAICALAVLNTFIIPALSKRRQLRRSFKATASKTTVFDKTRKNYVLIFIFFASFSFSESHIFPFRWLHKNIVSMTIFISSEQNSIFDAWFIHICLTKRLFSG